MQALMRLATVGAVVLAFALAGCGGSQTEETTPVGETSGGQVEQGGEDAGAPVQENIQDAGTAAEAGAEQTGEPIE